MSLFVLRVLRARWYLTEFLNEPITALIIQFGQAGATDVFDEPSAHERRRASVMNAYYFIRILILSNSRPSTVL
jgi:hypothetical protein